MIEFLSYLEFNYLVEKAKAVIIDFGGIIEEVFIMNVFCLTLRDNMECPEIITLGINELVGMNPENIKFYLQKLFSGDWKKVQAIFMWDGQTATKIVKVLQK